MNATVHISRKCVRICASIVDDVSVVVIVAVMVGAGFGDLSATKCSAYKCVRRKSATAPTAAYEVSRARLTSLAT